MMGKPQSTLIHVQGTSDFPRLTQLGISMALELVNKRQVPMRLRAYSLEVSNRTNWIRLLPLRMDAASKVCIATAESLAKAVVVAAETDSFDYFARETLIQPGDGVRGWMFFAWPSESKPPSQIDKLRFTFQDSYGRSVYTLPFTNLWSKEPGLSSVRDNRSVLRTDLGRRDLTKGYFLPPEWATLE